MNSHTTSLRAVMISTLFYTLPILCLSGQTSVWTGTAADQNPFEPFNTWAWNGNWQDSNLPNGETHRNIEFGASSYYTPIIDDNDGNYYRIRTLTFKDTAGQSYTLSGETLIFYDMWIGALVNESQYQQIFENDFQFGINPTGSITVAIDTGSAGILWSGNSSKTTSGFVAVNKTGSGSLVLSGSQHAGIDRLYIHDGELVILASDNNMDFSGGVNLYGGNLRVIGLDTGETTVNIAFGYGASAVSTNRLTKIIVDSNGGDGTLLNFTSNTGLSGTVPVVYFDLSADNTAVHFVNGLGGSGIGGVYKNITVTDSSGKTGFAMNKVNPGGGYDIERFEPVNVLPTTGNWQYNWNYYVNLTEINPVHIFSPANIPAGTGGSLGADTTTLTLQGSGTLILDNRHLRTQAFLLEEGTGDFTITGLGLAGRNATLPGITTFSYRDPQQGALIIDTDYFGYINATGDSTSLSTATHINTLNGSWLSKAGPGTLVFRSSFSNIVAGIYVQEGRLQVESDGFDVSALVDVYEEATLGGSGQIGGGARWVWTGPNNGGTAIIDGTRYTPVIIYRDGTIDVTPATHTILEDLRGLQIHGTLTLQEGANLAMSLNSDVLEGNYDPLRVIAENTASTVVTLTGDLQLELLGHFSSTRWITLLETDGQIGGAFNSVNGLAFGEDNHFILSYGGRDYDFYLHYIPGSMDNEGIASVALYAIPEPSTIALILGGAMIGFLFIRRKKSVE